MRVRTSIAETWVTALRTYVERGDEGSLAAAYDLGRRALVEGLGLIELSRVHADAVASLTADGDGNRDLAQRAFRFFVEALAPSELALRGYRDSVAELQAMTRSLEGRVEERTRELAQAERRLRDLVEQVPVVLYISSPNSTEPFRYVSPQILGTTGYPAEEWRALPGRWGGRLHPDDVERVEGELAQSVAEERTFLSEYRILRKEGGIAWVRDEARLVKAEGTVRHQGVWMDVTGMRALEDQLRQAQKLDALGRLASGVAHDFNNLLSAILSFGRFLKEDLAGHPSLPDVEDILRAAERGAGLTRQLLAFSRKQAFRPQVVDLNELIAGMERMLARIVGERVSIKMEPGVGLHALFADPNQLEQVVLNLVVNAGDAMPDGGVVTLETQNVVLDEAYVRGRLGAPPGHYVLLSVSDTGVGMDEATQRRIFEPFFTTKAPGKGTGLGLATVYGVVRQLGGDILVYSAPGRGTTFKVYFPRSWEETPDRPGDGDRQSLPRGSESILLVEDDPQVRSVAARALRTAGFQVREAGSVGEAETILAQPEAHFELLLTDMVLVDSTGDALVRRVRAQRKHLRVLFMSGYSEIALERQGVSLFGAALLEKPFTPDTLVRTVRSLLDEPEKS